MFLLVSVLHVGAHPDEFEHGVSIQSSINLVKIFPRISRIRIIPSTQILARVFVYLPPFISQILDFICRMVFTVKPVLSRHRIKWTVAEVPKFISLIIFIKQTPLLSGGGHLKST